MALSGDSVLTLAPDSSAAELMASGVQVVCLLALNDMGAPGFDTGNAANLAAMGIPLFACTPDLFPDLMAAAITRQDLGLWAAKTDIVVARSTDQGNGTRRGTRRSARPTPEAST